MHSVLHRTTHRIPASHPICISIRPHDPRPLRAHIRLMTAMNPLPGLQLPTATDRVCLIPSLMPNTCRLWFSFPLPLSRSQTRTSSACCPPCFLASSLVLPCRSFPARIFRLVSRSSHSTSTYVVSAVSVVYPAVTSCLNAYVLVPSREK